MSIPRVFNIEDAALDKLLFQWQEQEVVTGILNGITSTMQPVQQDLLDIMLRFGISTSEGDRLDQIGLLLDVDRAGATEAGYRTAINNAIARYKADGTPNKTIDLLKVLSGGDDIRIFEKSGRQVDVFVGQGDPSSFKQAFQDMLPLGVGGALTHSTSPSTMFIGGSDDGLGNITNITQAVLPYVSEVGTSDVVMAWDETI